MTASMTIARRGFRPAPFRWLACAVGLSALAGTAQAAMDCAGLAGVTTADATITSAAIVNPPATIGGVAISVPFCRVQGVARPSTDSEIKFEVWLPPTATDWTRRLKVNGTGGYAGCDSVCAAVAGHGRRLRHRGQQHGPRRRRVAELDARSAGEGQGLGPAGALLGGHRGQGA